MNRLSIKLGYWSAVLSIILGIGYGIGFTLAGILFPIPAWTNLSDFLAAVQPKPASLVAFGICQVATFFIGPAFLVLFCSLHEYAPNNKKILTRIGLYCMIATVVLGNQMYFVNFNAIRLILSNADLTGLEQFVEWNFNSAITASGALGWTFFVGLAFLFVAPIFSSGRLEQGLKYTFFVGGSCAILGMVSHLFQISILFWVYIIGTTVASIVLGVLASILFKRLENGAIIENLTSAIEGKSSKAV